MQTVLRVCAGMALLLIGTISAPAQPKKSLTTADPEHRFSLKLPPGFEPTPGFKSTSTEPFHYGLDTTNGKQPAIYLGIRMRTGPSIPLRANRRPPDFKSTMKWKAYTVGASQSSFEIDGTSWKILTVTIPLEKQTMTLGLSAPATRLSELQRLMPQILDGLSAISNWETSAVPISRPAKPPVKISDSDLGFSLSLPSEFQPPLRFTKTPEVPYQFMIGELCVDKDPISLEIKGLDHELEPTDSNQRSPDKHRTFNWQSHTIDAVPSVHNIEGDPHVFRVIGIPLKKRAIQIVLIGPLARQGEMQKLVPRILDGISGESNWKQRPAPIRVEGLRKLAMLAIQAGLLLATLVGFWLGSRLTPKGTLFIAGVGLWLLSFVLANLGIAGLELMYSATRLIGFSTIILGIVDLLLSRTVVAANSKSQSPLSNEEPAEVEEFF